MRTKIDRRPALVTLAGALMLLCAVWIDDVAAAAAAAVRQPASSSVEALGQPNDSAVDEMAAAHDGGSDEAENSAQEFAIFPDNTADIQPPMFDKKYFDYMPDDAEPDADGAVELEPFGMVFESMLSDEDASREPLYQPVPTLRDTDVIAVNHRAKRDAPQPTSSVPSSANRAKRSHYFLNRMYLPLPVPNPWATIGFAGGPLNTYLPPYAFKLQPNYNVGMPPNYDRNAVTNRPTTNHRNNVPPPVTSNPLESRFDNDDRDVGPIVTVASRPTAPTRAEHPPLIHDSDDDSFIPQRPSSSRPSPPGASAVADNSFNRPVPQPIFAPAASVRPSWQTSTGRVNDNPFRPVFPESQPPIWGIDTPFQTAYPEIQAPVWGIVNGRGHSNSIQPPSNWLPPPTKAPRVPAAMPGGPSACVLAIVNCCDNRRYAARQSCFERFGCDGPIWDVDRCSNSVRTHAVNTVDTFFS